MNYHVIVPTYNRASLLDRMLGQLSDDAVRSGATIDVHVYDDGSDVPYSPEICLPAIRRFDVQRRRTNGGKRFFWHLISYALKRASQALDTEDTSWDYLLMLEDDVQVLPGFLAYVTAAWDAIEDPRKACLSTLADHKRISSGCWTVHPGRSVVLPGGRAVWRTQWMDMLIISDRRFVELVPHVLPIPLDRWKETEALSSGVGRQISVNLDAAGYSLYHVDEILLQHGDTESVMHPWRDYRIVVK